MVFAWPVMTLWVVHACMSVAGRRLWSMFYVLLVGAPLLCVADYLMLVHAWHPTGGIAEGDPAIDRWVVGLFVGVVAWVGVLVVEPLLVLADHLVARRRERMPRAS